MTNPRPQTAGGADTTVATPVALYAGVVPAPFPDLGLPNFNFPEDSNTLNGWIRSDQTAEIYTHVWGLWKGLNMETGQSVGDHPLRVFETWMTPDMMKAAMKGDDPARVQRHYMRQPVQHKHFGNQVIDTDIRESVAYSPAAAKYAIDNKLMLAPDLLARARANTPIDFPSNAITIKPVFKLLKGGDGTTQPLIVWPGPRPGFHPEGYAEADWKSMVYIDLTNQSSGADGTYLTIPASGQLPQPTPATTYNLNDFVHFTLTVNDVDFYNEEFPSATPAQVGDKAILVGMHVTTKENVRWTWQSYWWTPDADNPPLPSSKAMADARASVQLTGAPAHYAATASYYMVAPDEPYDGTNVMGSPNYSYNPYLEAPFASVKFDTARSFIQVSSSETIPTYAGVRTNCMSCHGTASIDPSKFTASMDPTKASSTPYLGDTYVGLNDPMFNGQFKTDLAWSIPGEMDTTGLAAYLAQSTAGQ